MTVRESRAARRAAEQLQSPSRWRAPPGRVTVAGPSESAESADSSDLGRGAEPAGSSSRPSRQAPLGPPRSGARPQARSRLAAGDARYRRPPISAGGAPCGPDRGPRGVFGAAGARCADNRLRLCGRVVRHPCRVSRGLRERVEKRVRALVGEPPAQSAEAAQQSSAAEWSRRGRVFSEGFLRRSGRVRCHSAR